jgi:hypothetical protein
MRRAGLALALLAALAFTSTAAAQSPRVDPLNPSPAQRRAQATAYGDAGLQLRADAKRLVPTFRPSVTAAKGQYKCVVRALERANVRDFPDDVIFLISLNIQRDLARILSPALRRFVARLDAAPAVDRILNGGADVWRRLVTAYSGMAAVKGDGCKLARAWAATGWKPSARPPALDTLVALITRLTGDNGAVAERAELRLLQLGVSSRAARAFSEGFFDEDER